MMRSAAVSIFYDCDRLLFGLGLIPLSSSVGKSSDTCDGGKRTNFSGPGLAAVTRSVASVLSASVQGHRSGAGTVVEPVESYSTHSTKCAIAKGVADGTSRCFALSFAVMSDDLACGDSSKCSSGDVTLDAGFAAAISILFFVVVDIIITIVVLLLVITVSAVNLLVPTFIIVIFFLLLSNNRPFFFVDGLLNAFANNDSLRSLLPDNDGLHLHLHGLSSFIADVDGLRLGRGLGSRLGAEILSRPRVLLQLVRLLSWKDLLVALKHDFDLCALSLRWCLVGGKAWPFLTYAMAAYTSPDSPMPFAVAGRVSLNKS